MLWQVVLFNKDIVLMYDLKCENKIAKCVIEMKQPQSYDLNRCALHWQSFTFSHPTLLSLI